MPSREPLRVLLVKPYQPTRQRIACPPLGLLYLAATLRKAFGNDVEVRLLDLMVAQARYTEARKVLDEFRPHAIPLPACDLIDFDRYAKVRNFMSLLKGRRYATIFTSRGCPFLCTSARTQRRQRAVPSLS